MEISRQNALMRYHPWLRGSMQCQLVTWNLFVIYSFLSYHIFKVFVLTIISDLLQVALSRWSYRIFSTTKNKNKAWTSYSCERLLFKVFITYQLWSDGFRIPFATKKEDKKNTIKKIPKTVRSTGIKLSYSFKTLKNE